MDNEKEKIRGLLEKGMNTDYSTMEKIKAFTYHVAMVSFGFIFCPEKYENYCKVFDEYIKMNEENKKEAEKNATE